MTLDNIVEADILSTCNALGSEIKGIYEKGNDCIECLKDILRYLKRDNEDHSVLRFLGSIRLLQTDLVPIIKQYNENKEIFDFTLRILVALTNPALLLYKEDLPEDKISRNVYLQLISYLQSYKKAFIDNSVWEIFYEHLKDLLKIRPIERSSNENLFIERILILIRNVLHVPSDDSICKITDDDLSPHDKILQCLHESKINILLLYMSANEEEHQYCLHILEIISLMFREHTSETLANSNETRSKAEKEKDLNVLLASRQREQNLKLQKMQTMCTSRFNGVYYVKNMKSISDKDYIAHRLIANAEDIKFDLKKDAKRKPKNRVRAADIDNSRDSTLSTRLFLKKFCIEFLKTYNKLMVSVKREILRKLSEEHDDTYYLWAICYFMEFNRLHDFQPALVSETITMQSFHHIQTQITNYHEMMLTDKKKTLFWAKRMQLGVNAYKELLETLREMEISKDEIVRNSADALISRVFYVIEYREMLLSLLSSFDEVKFPLSYLAKLVESIQLFLKMLENHSKKHSEIIVQKKQRKIQKKRKKKPVVNNEPVNVQDQLNEQWNTITSELSAAVNGHRPIPNVTPFDGASEMSFEEQKVEAIYKIREALISNEPFKALALLRASRELWPEGDSFGLVDVEPEPEFLILREIHFSDLHRSPNENNTVEVEEEDSNEDDEEMEALPPVTEQKLDMDEVYKKYASPKIVQPCCLLLANYQKNKPRTNLCLIKLLHRIAWNCKMYALFFQSSIFLTFQKVFHDPDINCDPIIKELYRFARFIIQKFFVAAEKNDKIFVELLFWKGPRDAYELEEGYEASESRIKGWTEDEEEELKYLYEENKDIYIEGQDVADIILANFNPRNRTKPQIISALKRLSLIQSVKDLKPEQRKEWQETEITELQNLFEDYRNSEDVMTIILDKLFIKRSRKAVIEKLLELNLIQDRKELRKRSLKNHKKSSTFSDSDGNLSGENDDILYNEETHGNHSYGESSGDEDEINFFKNLEAERLAEDSENNASYSEKKLSKLNCTIESKRMSQFWEEQEIMELTTLYQENHESDNIMHILLNTLSRKRPKQAIVEKLLELGLIKDKKEIRKKRNSEKNKKESSNSKSNKDGVKDSEDYHSNSESDTNNILNKIVTNRNKLKCRMILDSSDEENISGVNLKSKRKQQKVWEEKEINELNRLFLEHKNSDDIIFDIIKHLTFKQTKKNIVEKLLEIGLIKSKAEIKNKNSSLSKELSAKPVVDNVPEKGKRKKYEVWEEREIIELNQLFLQHKDSEDIISNIIRDLTFKQTKKNITEKLLEIGLIKSKAEIKKKLSLGRKLPAKLILSDVPEKIKQKKHSDVWEEQEILELTQLYQSNKDSYDIMTNILHGLTVKRHKQNVIKKMLEIGLIRNKNEVRKKTLSKQIKAKQNLLNMVDSEDEILKVNMNQQKRLSKRVLSDSSDDESLPLSHIVSTVAEINNYCKIDSSQTDFEISLPNKTSIVSNNLSAELPRMSSNSFQVAINDDISTRNNKRKIQLVSGDSSDDDDANIVELCKSNSVNPENSGINALELNFDNYSLPKLRKKKMRILDDSDDSN